jgi:hypothetical protein
MRYGPLRQIWIRTTGHGGEFGSAPGATVTDLVIRYGPLHGIKLCSKNLYRFLRCGPWRMIWLCAMGHNAVFGYALGAVHRIWLWATGCSAGFASALRAVVQDLVMRFGP